MLEISDMEFDDIDEVVKIERENFSVPWNENGFFSLIIKEGAVFLCARKSGTIVGYAGMVTAADEADITNISVSKNHRNIGIATAIIKELFYRGKKIGIKRIFLEVRKNNSGAINLYEKLGFKALSVRKDYYEAPLEDAVVMLKEL